MSYVKSLLPRLSIFVVFCLALVAIPANPAEEQWQWETLAADGVPTARHEASLVAVNGKIYLLGGRHINPVDEYDPVSNTWREKATSPIEFHHVQAVAVDGKIYIVGAMTGPWPNETPLDRVLIYDPVADSFTYGHEIPEDRRRGGAGAVYHNGKIYLIGGITNGHMNGYVNWADEYDPATGEWRVLPNAPIARDHVAIAASDNKLYVFGGRRSEHAIGNNFGPTERQGDVLDLSTMIWADARDDLRLPTTRAGHSAIAVAGHILIGGGESEKQETAHNEVEGYDISAGYWRRWPSLQRGRHGTGFVQIGDYLYTASGAGNRGGGPELTSIERLRLPQASASQSSDSAADSSYQQFGLVELDFEGPDTSETAETNPFTDFSLIATFRHGDIEKRVLGFYAADGNAAKSSADSGNVWRVRFTPELQGEWSYDVELRRHLDCQQTLEQLHGHGRFLPGWA